MRLLAYVEDRGNGWVLQDVDLLFASGHFLRPDLVVVPTHSRAGITDRGVEAPPALVVEVLSPSSRTIDRERKPRRYLELGVPAYWVVDPEESVIWTWDGAAGPEVPAREEGTVHWGFPAGEPPLELEVASLLAPL